MLKEYKFDKLSAINHIEAVNGKKLESFKTFIGLLGQPRVYWKFEGDKKEEWCNPDPMICDWGLDGLFFPSPKTKVISRKICASAGTFEFVVREGD